MSEFALLSSFIGRIAIEIDPNESGRTATGRRTPYAVTSVLIGDQVRAGLSNSKSKATATVRELVADWLTGDVQALDAVGVHLRGTEFQVEVLQAMRRIPAGATASYGQLAAAAGHPQSIRATGSVCARNRVPLIVPCHRVVRSGGELGNYYYGLDMKAALLQHEGVALVER